MLSHAEYNHRVKENIETMTAEFETISFCANNYHFQEKNCYEDRKINEHVNSYDIIGATLLGELPSNEKHGADGFRLVNGVYEPVEYKKAGKAKSLIWKTERDNLNCGPYNIEGSRKPLRSTLRAKYEIKNNLASKNMPTVLFVFDDTNQVFVSGFELDGNTIVERLASCKAAKRTITLSCFMKHGTEIEFKVGQYVNSYTDWEDELKETSRILQPGEML